MFLLVLAFVLCTYVLGSYSSSDIDFRVKQELGQLVSYANAMMTGIRFYGKRIPNIL